MKVCKQYHKLLQKILDEGVWRADPNRQDTRRLQIPFTTMSVDVREGFPLLTTKKMWWKGIVTETLWLLKGNSNIKELVDQGVDIWNKDAYNYYKKHYGKAPQNLFTFDEFVSRIKEAEELRELINFQDTGITLGDIGRMYGKQWRNWKSGFKTTKESSGIRFSGSKITSVDYTYEDQLSNAIWDIQNNPLSSNIRIFGDNPADADEQALPCCMDYMQFSCESFQELEKGNEDKINYYLDLTIHYRSWDVILGAPWNVAQYALILHIIAKMTNKIPRYLNVVSNNVHLYDNQIKAAKEQLERDTEKYDLPELKLPFNSTDLWKDNLDNILKLVDTKDFKIENYQSYPKLDNQPEMISYT